MKITEQQLQKRVALWQKRLGFLGISHWRLAALQVSYQSPSGDDSALATMQASEQYDSVKLWFNQGYLEAATGWDDVDESIVHEFVHVAMRDLDVAIMEAEDFLSAASVALWAARVTHAREGLVDRVARQIVDGFKA